MPHKKRTRKGDKKTKAIFLQAKRWDGNVIRPEIQKFGGALQGQRARKGIFITTSSFTEQALDYVRMIATKIILIDGGKVLCAFYSF
ncbi:MAG: restriction endonuclease [Opitutales bacterium]|nr:restriction endonuclease [Opitutales bacterium]MCH8541569.1 restriction endonuclease [Opitutales bacterium]